MAAASQTQLASRKTLHAHMQCRSPSRSSCVRPSAVLQHGGMTKVVSTVRDGATKFLQRYEQKLLPSTVGALAVTTYCVARGQEPATAAVITVAATVTALVLNEVLFDDISSS